MSGFKGEVEQFSQAEKNVVDVKNSMVQNLNKLRDNIEATRAGWSGPAAEAFNNVMMRFDENSRKMYDSLEGIGNLLQQAGSKYQAAEDAQLDSVNSVARSMPGL
ncbi:WXG100 family type VII secretion target [Amycolatopsis arida]|uniref:ESAT-6-like protein n=1 Tax=Amycolatopsis arida TaxID=587909 RepID=A0A1I5X2P1_9PSEU|nr:WXG100 family type VII secretion target [Amycolatopsis arida]TDX92576.1 WXG100 family type VII secretion target [Amycolatopsis arida]SFQ26272.1 WXG100 family type VII secretion target [Amycolatopsis arida]